MVPRDYDNIKVGDILEVNNEKVELEPEGNQKAVDLWNNKVRGRGHKVKVIQRRNDQIVTEWVDGYPDNFYQSDTICFPETHCCLIDFVGVSKTGQPRMSADGCLINEDGTLVHPTGRFEFL